MAGERWQIGLDIQPHGWYALAVVPRRRGWQVKGCWQQALPGEDAPGGLPATAPLVASLRRWRQALPRRYSLRLALPAERVLQRILPAPDTQLRAPYRETFLLNQAAKQFPLAREALALDYRSPSSQPQQVVVTAAPQVDVAAWLEVMAASGLAVEVLEIAPCALQASARLAGLSAGHVLVHRFWHGWLWVAPRSQPFQFGVAAADTPLETLLPVTLHGAPVAFSSVLDAAPPGVQAWSPLATLSEATLPTGTPAAAFVLAVGLAVRPEDRP